MSTRIENAPIAPPLYIDSANNRVGINRIPQYVLDVKSTGVGSYPLIMRNSSDNIICTLKDQPEAIFDLRTATGTIRINFRPDGNSYIHTGTFAVGANATSASAIMEIASTTLGFLPPRMSTVQKDAIASPATGLMVFDTNLAKLCVYTGAAWETITSA